MSVSRSGSSALPPSRLGELARSLFAIDTRSLAAFRVILAATQLIKLWEVFPHAQALLSDDGVLPRRLFLRDAPVEGISLYFLNGTYPFVLLLLALHLIASLALLVGYRSWLAAFSTWILAVSLMIRNPLINTGGDSLSCLLLFWAIFLPIGENFSADAAMAPEKRVYSHLSIATAGVLLQALYVYFFGALLKTGAEWTSGAAVYWAMHVETTATGLAHWVRQFPWATYPATHFVFWIELLSPLLLFFPWRTSLARALVLPFYFAMHLGFRLFLSISNFWLVSIASLTIFLPSQVWARLDRVYWSNRQRAIIIYYDQNCDFCRKVSLILREFFLPKEVQVLPAQGVPDIGDLLEREQSWVVTDGDGTRRLHWRALAFVVGQSIVFRPLAWLLALYGAVGLGRPTYDLIGRNRRLLGKATVGLKPRPPFPRLAAVTQIALCCVIAFCLFWNVRRQAGITSDPAFIQPVVSIAKTLRFTQGWGMFAPFPQKVYVVPVIEGRLANGQSRDVLNNRPGAPSYEWPLYPVDAVRPFVWRKYFDNLGVHSEGVAEEYFTSYATYACNTWNRGHRGGERMVDMTITLLVGQTLPDNRTDTSQRKIYDFTCFDLAE